MFSAEERKELMNQHKNSYYQNGDERNSKINQDLEMVQHSKDEASDQSAQV